MGIFKAFFRNSGELAYETTDFDGFIAEHRAISGAVGVIDVNGDDRSNADYIVFEVEDADLDFDIYNLRHLPEGVQYVGHYNSVPDYLDESEAA